jgi:hypothetical protein
MAPRKDKRGKQCLAVFCNTRLGSSVVHDAEGNVVGESHVPSILVPSNEKEEGFSMQHRYEVLLALFTGLDEKEAGWRAEDRARELCEKRDRKGQLVKYMFCRTHMRACDIEIRGNKGTQWRILPGRLPCTPTVAANAAAQAHADRLHSSVEGVATRRGPAAGSSDAGPVRKKRRLEEVSVEFGPPNVEVKKLSRAMLIARLHQYEAYIDEMLAAKTEAETKARVAAEEGVECDRKYQALVADLEAVRKENEKLHKDAQVRVCVCVCLCACVHTWMHGTCARCVRVHV